MKLLVFLQRRWGKIVTYPFVKELQKRYENMEIHALISKPSTLDAIKNDKDFRLKSYHYYTKIYEEGLKSEEASISLDEIEKDLKITSIWEYVLQDRILCYDMATVPFTERSQFTNDEMVRIVKYTYLYIKEIMEKVKPDVIHGPNNVSFFHQLVYAYARSRQIINLTIGDSRINGYLAFADPITNQITLVDKQYEKNLNEEINNTYYREAEEYVNSNRERLIKPLFGKPRQLKVPSIQEFIRESAGEYKAWLKNKIHRESVKLVKSTDNLPLFTRIYNLVKIRRNITNVLKNKTDQNWKNKKYIYFPLQYQPEASTIVIANRYVNQVETCRQIAASLPGDYCLVVKEHPQMLGRRNIEYYQDIGGIPNVYLADIRMESQELIKNAALTISTSGTTAYEAALMDVGSIIMGHAPIQTPHMRKLESFEKLSDLIKEIGAIDYSKPFYRNSVISYVAAVFEKGIKGNFTMAYRGQEQLTKDSVDQMVNGFMETLKVM